MLSSGGGVQFGVGMMISGVGIPSGATITAVSSSTSITISSAATASGTGTLTATMSAGDVERFGAHAFLWPVDRADLCDR